MCKRKNALDRAESHGLYLENEKKKVCSRWHRKCKEDLLSIFKYYFKYPCIQNLSFMLLEKQDDLIGVVSRCIGLAKMFIQIFNGKTQMDFFGQTKNS